MRLAGKQCGGTRRSRREVAVDGYDEYIFYKCMEVLKNKILITKNNQNMESKDDTWH